MKKRTVSVIAILLLLTSCLTACRAPEAKTQEKETGFKPSLDPKTACTIQVAGHYSNFEALEDEFNLFSSYYPEVSLVYSCLDNYNGIIARALESSEAPDIFFTFPWMIDRADLQPLFDRTEDLSSFLDLSCIRDGLLTPDHAGRISCVPVFATTYGMLVNEEIFVREGLSVPKTYSELLSVCEALKKAGYSSPVLGYNRDSFLLYPMCFPYFCSQIRENKQAVSDMNALLPASGEAMRPMLELTADFMGHGYVDLDECNTFENDYQAVIMRFFEGNVPMMMASAGTVSGTQKRESQSEAFSSHPFTYSFHPVPSTDDGGFFMDQVALCFSVNKNSPNLDMVEEYMRFLISEQELNRMASSKRMVTTCKNMSLDRIYAPFGELDEKHIIHIKDIGLMDAPDIQVRKAGWAVSNGRMTTDEAIAAFGNLP